MEILVDDRYTKAMTLLDEAVGLATLDQDEDFRDTVQTHARLLRDAIARRKDIVLPAERLANSATMIVRLGASTQGVWLLDLCGSKRPKNKVLAEAVNTLSKPGNCLVLVLVDDGDHSLFPGKQYSVSVPSWIEHIDLDSCLPSHCEFGDDCTATGVNLSFGTSKNHFQVSEEIWNSHVLPGLKALFAR
jgi:hypothetical protein